MLSLKHRSTEHSAQDHQLRLTETCLRCGPNKSQASQLKGHISQHVHDSAFSRVFFYRASEQYMVERWYRRGTTSEFSEIRIRPIASLPKVFLLTMGSTS